MEEMRREEIKKEDIITENEPKMPENHDYRSKNAKSEEKKKGKGKIIALILILLLIIGALAGFLFYTLNQEEKTAILVETEGDLTSNETGQVRIVINSSINIEEGTMQDICFANYNEDRDLICKLNVDGEYVYESQLVEPGEMIQADVIDEDKVPDGETEATAEVYSYNDEGELMGQTNAKVTLRK